MFASEIQPMATRATATSLSQSANCVSTSPYSSLTLSRFLPITHQITNFFVAFITPVLLAHSSSAIYFLFAGCSFITVMVCLIVMPETGMESLENITVVFQNHHAKDTTIIQIPRMIFSSFATLRQRRGNSHGIRSRVMVDEIDLH